LRRPRLAGGDETVAHAPDLSGTLQDMRRQGPDQANGLSMADSASPVCMACNRERLFVSAEPVRRGYEITSYKCPTCGSVLRLGQKRRKARPPKLAPRQWAVQPKKAAGTS
jgi:predicted RNA-binding Zn-ribbon protein involved in translation (DUF1610 family)